VPVASTLDAESCDVALRTDFGAGTSTIRARGAEFRVDQRRGPRAATDLHLEDPHCGSGAAAGPTAGSSRHRKPPYQFVTRVVPPRALGQRAVAAAAAVGGTVAVRVIGRRATVAAVGRASWVTTETCRFTIVRVLAGRVDVRDRARARTLHLHAGQRFTAG
jgi:hypothetical protein